MSFCRVLFEFFSLYFLDISYRFLVCGYHVLSYGNEAMCTEVYFKCMVWTHLNHYQFYSPPPHLCFHRYFLLLLWVHVCVHPLPYCCNYTRSSYFCLLTFVLALVLVDPLLLLCLCLCYWDFFYSIFLFIFFIYFLLLKEAPLPFFVILVWWWWTHSLFLIWDVGTWF